MPFVATAAIYWSSLDSPFSCGLNLGQNISILSFLPFVFYMAIGAISTEAVGVDLRWIGPVNFIHPNLEENAK